MALSGMARHLRQQHVAVPTEPAGGRGSSGATEAQGEGSWHLRSGRKQPLPALKAGRKQVLSSTFLGLLSARRERAGGKPHRVGCVVGVDTEDGGEN